MPYASKDRVTEAPHEGATKITEAEYVQAREALLNRQTVFIHQGKLVIIDKPEQKSGYELLGWDGEAWEYEKLPEPEPTEEETE